MPLPSNSRNLLTIALCFLLNFNDGIDIFVVSYSGPEIIHDLGLSKTEMGYVFSLGLLGILLGSFLIAPLGDRWGRKNIALASTLLCTGGMAGVALTQTYHSLLIFRLITGLGIGGIVPTISAIVADQSSPRRRDFHVGLVQAGWPMGAIVAGLACAYLIPKLGWHAAFGAAAIFSACLFVLVALLLPAQATAHSPSTQSSSLLRQLWRPPLLRTTFRLAAAAFFGFLTLYTVMSWIPNIAKEAGLPFTLSSYVGIALNIGAGIGSAAIGAIGFRLGLRRTIFVFMCIAFVLMQLYAFLPLQTILIFGLVFLLGVFVQGGFNGIFPLVARSYPSSIRAGSIGYVIGSGRIGAIIGPGLFGWLADIPLNTSWLFILFSLPLLAMGLLVRRDSGG